MLCFNSCLQNLLSAIVTNDCGKGCLDEKSRGSALSLPGSYFISKSTSCMSITHFSMWGGSFAVGLLNSGRRGLCAVTMLNLGAPSREIENQSLAHFKHSVSFSV